MSDEHTKQMYNDVRRGMNLHEQILAEGVHDKAIFKAVFLAGGPGSGKDYVLSNTLDGHGMVEINSDKAFEYLLDREGKIIGKNLRGDKLQSTLEELFTSK
jgi:hypothetical protein